MTGQPVKQLPLCRVCCKVADQGAFSGLVPELLDLRQVVLHCRCPALCPEFRPVNNGSQSRHSYNTTPPSDETVAGGAESLDQEGTNKIPGKCWSSCSAKGSPAAEISRESGRQLR